MNAIRSPEETRAEVASHPGEDAPRAAWLRAHAALLGGVALVLAAFALYQRTMVRTVLGGDPGDFQIAAVVLGVPHPPGYPLWVLLAHGFYALIPLRDAAWRVNLTSPVYAALAVGLVYAIGRRLGVRAWLAATAAAAFAVAPEFWGEAVEPRAYALNALQVALAIWLLLRWRDAVPARRGRWLGAFGLVVGSFLANHATSLALLPGFALFVLGVEISTIRAARQPLTAALRARLADAGLLIAGVALGLAPFLLPVARFLQGGGPYYWGAPQSWADVWRLITAADFRSLVFGVPWSQFGDRVAWGAGILLAQYGWPGVIAGLLGWAVLARRDPLVFGMLALGWVLSFVSGIMYASETSYYYLIPGQLLWALVLGQAGEAAMSALARRGPGVATRTGTVRIVGGVLAALLLLAVSAALVDRYPRVDRSHDTWARDQGEATLAALAPNALVFARWEATTILRYYQLVEGRRTDVLLQAGNPADWAGQIRAALQAGRAVYVNLPPDDVRRQFKLTPAALVERAELPP